MHARHTVLLSTYIPHPTQKYTQDIIAPPRSSSSLSCSFRALLLPQRGPLPLFLLSSSFSFSSWAARSSSSLSSMAAPSPQSSPPPPPPMMKGAVIFLHGSGDEGKRGVHPFPVFRCPRVQIDPIEPYIGQCPTRKAVWPGLGRGGVHRQIQHGLHCV